MGPLKGLKIIEMVGIGPGPFCGMVLADLGAEVIRVDRVSAIGGGSKQESSNRGKKSIAVDLKSKQGVEVVLKLVKSADAIFEGFRPGVMERLGLGPAICLEKNEKIVYGRMTGWAQDGPLAKAAGHDINYISLSGALAAIGRPGSPPVPPLNLIGDFGGGGMLLALGLVAALFESKGSKKGQIVDAAMIDGSALLMTMIYTMQATGFWKNSLGSNLLDGGAHFYDTYGNQMSRDSWSEQKVAIKKIFLEKTRKEWCDLMEGTDICFAPVLNMTEAPKHPHNVERKTFIDLEGVTQPAPAPRFSRTKAEVISSPALVGEHSEEILKDLGLSEEEIASLRSSGGIA